MLKLILLIIVAFLGGFMESNFSVPLNNIEQSFSYIQSVNVLNNNSQLYFEKESQEFNDIISSLNEIIAFSHEMPAFGVSLHTETINAKKQGVWLELNFNKNLSLNDMPFSSLLIKVESESCGFNLIRKVSGKYEGRCFYLSLQNNMQSLYEKILTFY